MLEINGGKSLICPYDVTMQHEPSVQMCRKYAAK